MIKVVTESAARPSLTFGEVTDPELCAVWNALRAQADRNRDWFQANLPEIVERHRGQWVCVAGQELFAADDLPMAFLAAKAKHPEDHGRICEFIPRQPKAAPPPLKVVFS
ncbi:MAG: hypothetical protein U0746_04255 [Gemmataceae bacterium]